MMNQYRQIDRDLLTAVSFDFQPLEVLIGTLLQRHETASETSGERRIYRRLLSLIQDGSISANLLHAEPPYVTPVQATPATMSSCWFLITEKGREHLCGVPNCQTCLERTQHASSGAVHPPCNSG